MTPSGRDDQEGAVSGSFRITKSHAISGLEMAFNEKSGCSPAGTLKLPGKLQITYVSANRQWLVSIGGTQADPGPILAKPVTLTEIVHGGHAKPARIAATVAFAFSARLGKSFAQVAWNRGDCGAGFRLTPG
jgi:hypothetical protein